MIRVCCFRAVYRLASAVEAYAACLRFVLASDAVRQGYALDEEWWPPWGTS